VNNNDFNQWLGKFLLSVVNTPGALYSPVMNTPGNRLLGVFGTSIRTGLQQKNSDNKYTVLGSIRLS
jgi:hypothetical protein